MADINKDNLLYVPKIEPEQDYRSDARFPKETIPHETIPDNEPETDTPRDIYNDLSELQELLKITGVPELEFINETIERLKKRLEIAFPDGNPPTPALPTLDPNSEPPKPKTPPSMPSIPYEPPTYSGGSSYSWVPHEITNEGNTHTWDPYTGTDGRDPATWDPHINTGGGSNPWSPTIGGGTYPGGPYTGGSTGGGTTGGGGGGCSTGGGGTPHPGGNGGGGGPTGPGPIINRINHGGSSTPSSPWYVNRDYVSGPAYTPGTSQPIEHEVEHPSTFDKDIEVVPPEEEDEISEHHIYGVAEEAVNPENSLIEVPEMYPNATNVKLDVVPPRTLVQIIQDNYARDTVNLQNFYTQKLQLILQKYFQKMLTVMAECNVDSIDKLTMDFDGEYVTVSDFNMRHLRDSVCRSQIMRDQKERFVKKMFSVDQTMLHMNRWHVSEKERETYYREKYGDSGTYLDSHSNTLLRDCRSQYDSAYNQSVYDMYKYLNSSCEALDDILEMVTREAWAKGKMLKGGVDIYKNRAVEEQKEADERRARELDELQKRREANKNSKPASMTGSGSVSSGPSVPSGGGGNKPASGGDGTCNSELLEKTVQFAIEVGSQGYPYTSGGGGPDNFDCTGFVSYVFNQTGWPISVCHGGAFDGEFEAAGFEYISFSGSDCSSLQRGDVLCNDHHTELYIGGGQQVGAHNSNSGVTVCDFWPNNFDYIWRWNG